MASTRNHSILNYLRQSLGTSAVSGVADADLLRRFVHERDEAAFELLLWRHAAMVLHVCRQTLRDAGAVEDAFQATFLVFVRKAGSISRRESLGGWLYRVASRIALKAGAQDKKRKSTDLDPDRLKAPADDADRHEVRRIISEEVNRLPAKYRAAIVACYFEAKTLEEAAHQLGWPRGTVASRLARARDLLRRRLVRRGVTLTMGALAAALSARTSQAALTGLIDSTISTAKLFAAGQSASAAVSPRIAALAEGVLKAMYWTRMKIVSVVLLIVSLGGAGAAFWGTERSEDEKPGESSPRAGGAEAAQPEAAAKLARNMALSRLTKAQDNVLGLPRPLDPRRPGAVVLHGGGHFTDSAFERFVALAGGRRARIVLVPSAGYRASAYDDKEQFLAAMRRRFSSWVNLASTGRVAGFQFLYTDDPNDAEDTAFVRPLASATGVWFCGGDQTRLNYRFVGRFPRQTKFQRALRGVLERGGVVGGTSAGMAALPEIMTLTQDRRRVAGPLSAVAAHGLGVLTGAVVEQHFDGRNGWLERFTDLLRDSSRLVKLSGRGGAGSKMLGLAVEEGTALILREDCLEVVGEGEVHVFLKPRGDSTIIWHVLGRGVRASLKRDRPDEVTPQPPRPALFSIKCAVYPNQQNPFVQGPTSLNPGSPAPNPLAGAQSPASQPLTPAGPQGAPPPQAPPPPAPPPVPGQFQPSPVLSFHHAPSSAANWSQMTQTPFLPHTPPIPDATIPVQKTARQ